MSIKSCGRRSGRCWVARRAPAVVLLAAALHLAMALAAWAITMSLSTNTGPPGTRVTVHLTDLPIPCEVRFDELLVVGESGCQPGADGTAAPSFAVPTEATVGFHQVRVTARRPGSSSMLSHSFEVTAPRPRSGTRAGGGATGGASPSPSPGASPGASPSPSPTPTPTATSSPGVGEGEAGPGSPPAGSETEESPASAEAAGSGLSGGAIALIAAAAGLTVAGVVYGLVSRRGRRVR